MSSPRSRDFARQRDSKETPADDVSPSPDDASPPASLLYEAPIHAPRAFASGSEDRNNEQLLLKAQYSSAGARKAFNPEPEALIPSFKAELLAPNSYATTPNRSPDGRTALFDGDDAAVTSGESAPNEVAPSTTHLDLPGSNLSPDHDYDGAVNPWTVPTARPSKTKSRAPPRARSRDRPREILRAQFSRPPPAGDPSALREYSIGPQFPPPSREQYPRDGDKVFKPLPPDVDGIDLDPILDRYDSETTQLVDFMNIQGKRCERSYAEVLKRDTHLLKIKKRTEDVIAARAQMEEERQLARQNRVEYKPRPNLVERSQFPCSVQQVYNLEEDLLKEVEIAGLDRAVLEGKIAGAAAFHENQYDETATPEQVSVLREADLLPPPPRNKVTDVWALTFALKKPHSKQPHYAQVDKIRTGYFGEYKNEYWKQWERAAEAISESEDAGKKGTEEEQVPPGLVPEGLALFEHKRTGSSKRPSK
ncbi:Fc.00g089040.m01.CDS01 [Cosmosporella sp. VM-42]